MGKNKKLFIVTDKQWGHIVKNCRLYANKTDFLPIAFNKSRFFTPVRHSF